MTWHLVVLVNEDREPSPTVLSRLVRFENRNEPARFSFTVGQTATISTDTSRFSTRN